MLQSRHHGLGRAMRRLASVALISLVTLSLLPAVGAPSQDKKDSDKPDKKPAPAAVAAPAGAPVYKPPLRGAPGGRVGGGTRGTGREVFVLSVLAPDHSGMTVSEQPSLYWYISTPTSLPVELTMMDPGTTQPLLEIKVPSPIEPGIHRLRLADHGVRLAPGVAYRWYVAVVPDAGRRSRDILAGGAIQRIDPSSELVARLGRARRDELPAVYAEAGLWYDALAAMSELIEGAPNDAALRQQRAALLTQIGLPLVAER
jgi:uncharacterized protein DUF928